MFAFPSATYISAQTGGGVPPPPPPPDANEAAAVDAIAVPPALPLLRAEVPLTDTLQVLGAVEEERRALRHLQHLYSSELAKLQDDAAVLAALLAAVAPDSERAREVRAQVAAAAEVGVSGVGAWGYRQRHKTAAEVSVARARARREGGDMASSGE